MNTGLIGLIIVLAVVAGAVITKRCTECLLAGSIVGAICMYGRDFFSEWIVALQNAVADNVWLWLVCGLFGSMIALLTASRGTFGFAKIIGNVCHTQRKSMFAAYIMGFLIFLDDYLNVLSVGTCMKNLFDKRKLPREALAFILDSTGAPVCVLLPFSTWAVFYSRLFEEQEAISSNYASGMSAYIHAIPLCFYPIFALIVVGLFCAGIFPKLGYMKTAFQRVEETGMVYSERSRKYNYEEDSYEEGGNIWNFVIPMASVVAVTFITNEILIGVIIGLVVCLIMYVPTKIMNMETFMDLLVSGYAIMLPVFFLMASCFCLQQITEAMGMTEYIINLAKPLLTPAIYPAVCFILLGGLTFITASDWGMSAVVIPIFIPLAAVLDANLPLTMAAIISGGTFGSHACFYADATVLSSQSAGIDNMEHAMSQMPYVAISASVAVVCFLVTGFLIT